MTVTISLKGYVKRIASSEYRAQKRGGKGVTGTDAKDEDFVHQVFLARNHDFLLLFTNQGRVHWLKVYQLPELSRYSRGRAITNLLQLRDDESVTRVIPVRDFSHGYLIMATASGVIKKTELKAFSRPMRGGIIALGLREDDRLIGVRVAREDDQVLLATKKGYAIRFSSQDVRPMGRPATGVRGLRLREDDAVVSLILARADATVMTVCSKGYGKRTPIEDYRLQGRGGMGIINIKTTERNGDVVSVLEVADDDDLMIATQRGLVVRTPVRGISSIGRATQGVRIIRFKQEDDQVASVGRVVGEDDPADDAGDGPGPEGAGPVGDAPEAAAPEGDAAAGPSAPVEPKPGGDGDPEAGE